VFLAGIEDECNSKRSDLTRSDLNGLWDGGCLWGGVKDVVEDVRIIEIVGLEYRLGRKTGKIKN